MVHLDCPLLECPGTFKCPGTFILLECPSTFIYPGTWSVLVYLFVLVHERPLSEVVQ